MRTSNLIVRISNLLNIRATGRKILTVLASNRRGLLVSEIVARSKRSERAVRSHLKFLLRLRLIKRKKVITKKGRLAYRYLAFRTHELIMTTKKEMLQRLRELETPRKGQMVLG